MQQFFFQRMQSLIPRILPYLNLWNIVQTKNSCLFLSISFSPHHQFSGGNSRALGRSSRADSGRNGQRGLISATIARSFDSNIRKLALFPVFFLLNYRISGLEITCKYFLWKRVPAQSKWSFSTSLWLFGCAKCAIKGQLSPKVTQVESRAPAERYPPDGFLIA